MPIITLEWLIKHSKEQITDVTSEKEEDIQVIDDFYGEGSEVDSCAQTAFKAYKAENKFTGEVLLTKRKLDKVLLKFFSIKNKGTKIK